MNKQTINPITAIVLAAGKGTRMKSKTPKVLHNLRGRPMLYHILKTLEPIKSVKQILIVVGHGGQRVEDEIAQLRFFSSRLLKKKKVSFIYQKQRDGTAGAVRCCLSKILYDNTIILCGDAPLIKSKTLQQFLTSHRRTKAQCSLLSAYLTDDSELGCICRDEQHNINSIREKTERQNTQLKGQWEVNSGTYAISKVTLKKYLPKISLNPRKKEYFFTDIVTLLYKDGKKIRSMVISDFQEIMGINDRKSLAQAENILRHRILENLMIQGVTIIDPQTTFIDEDVKIAPDTVIFPFTFIEKDVIIGSNCQIGPFIHIRPGTRIAQDTHLGNFVEISRSRVGRAIRAKHFCFIGDAVIGDNANIGAGVVFANYDGKRKSVTHIKEKAFIGSDSILVSPVTVGKHAVTGAGSVVTRDVSNNSVVVGVPAKPLKK